MSGTRLQNFDVVIENIETLGDNLLEKLNIVSDETVDYMKAELLKNIAVEDEHTLEELKRLGHPYGYKGGESQDIDSGITSRNGKAILEHYTESGTPHNDPLIHKQSGNLEEAVNTFKLLEKDRLILAVYVDESKAPYIKYLVDGSTKMIPRPVFSFTWQRIKDFCLAKVRNGLTQALSARGKKL